MKKIRFLLFLPLLWCAVACQKQTEEVPMETQIKEQLSKLTEMSELATTEYTITKIVKASDETFYTIGDRKILFSCKAIVKAGIDIQNFSSEDVDYDTYNNTITVHLPLPKILVFKMPVEDIKLEFKKVGRFRSEFSSDEKNQLLRQGEADIRATLPQLNILKDAKENARLFFTSLFSLLSIDTVEVYFDKI